MKQEPLRKSEELKCGRKKEYKNVTNPPHRLKNKWVRDGGMKYIISKRNKTKKKQKKA